MVVKKFEAKSMREALEMVKSELGPQAIIMSVRDYSRKYGLVGECTVEVTAAVSDTALEKKRFTDSKLREQDRKKLHQSPARSQSEVIHKMIESHTQKPAPSPRPMTATPYIDISDNPNHLQMEEEKVEAVPVENSPSARIKSAAQRAWSAMREPELGQGGTSLAGPSHRGAPEKAEILSLKEEIQGLKKIIEGFKKVPQNFVGPYPGADYGLSFDLSFMFEKLLEEGISAENAAEILQDAPKKMSPTHIKKRAIVEAYAAKEVLQTIQVVVDPFQAKVHVFMGSSGHGKTASLIKMASQLVLHERKRVAILTTDSVKLGAAEQLKIYAQILNVPFAVIRNDLDWQRIESQMNDFDAVLVDGPGLSLKTIEEISFLKKVLPPEHLQAQRHLVIAVTAKDADAIEMGRRYTSMNFTDIIFTGIDQSAHFGMMFNFQKRFQCPIHSFGTGSKIPEDYEIASKERILDLLFKITKAK